MARSQSRLTAEIDFNRNGKQHDFIRLPYSVHRSAYGWIPIPVACVKNGAGPRILLMAGNHGDEYEGQVALGKLIRDLEPDEVSGRIYHPALGEVPGGDGRDAHLAARRRQPQPKLSGRSLWRADRADRGLH
jgi:predicted deacylase